MNSHFQRMVICVYQTHNLHRYIIHLMYAYLMYAYLMYALNSFVYCNHDKSKPR